MKRPRRTHAYRADPLVKHRCRCGLPKGNAVHRTVAREDEDLEALAAAIDARRLGERGD